MKILVADDDRAARALLNGLLTKLGHEVVQAADGAEAWRMINDTEVRVVVTDWNMPAMEGPELCRRIRERAGPYVYLIMVTVRNDMQSFSVGMAAGADDFITKPIDVALLAARVRVAERILSLRQEVSELRAQQLPMCIYCKRIKDTDVWKSPQEYLSQHESVDLAERICPDCYSTHLASDFDKLGE